MRPTMKERTVMVTLILVTSPSRGSAADEVGAPQKKARIEKRMKLNNIGTVERYSCRTHRVYRQKKSSHNGEKKERVPSRV
ncbi:uncharacterized protein EV420DRAFT_773097 [Desarmillaria tabescens]|uniref:Secreted protein n=1 Tax=Armillaria tabescens TaxID=1929756 RepID=A0AA39IW80_ARMTA|nr:uncharacterized protein EV420DRAFT_773097 [Desarmillaria tabescens]KAK0431635.1 hypothetical protein EV420DRAFT_773097 [Desarmillaria tabescens]